MKNDPTKSKVKKVFEFSGKILISYLMVDSILTSPFVNLSPVGNVLSIYGPNHFSGEYYGYNNMETKSMHQCLKLYDKKYQDVTEFVDPNTHIINDEVIREEFKKNYNKMKSEQNIILRNLLPKFYEKND